MALFLLRALVWVIVPLVLIVLAVGPARSWRFLQKLWGWFIDRRHEPTAVLNRVVREHEKNIQALREVLRQAEAAQADIVRNSRRSEDNIAVLEREARDAVRNGDDLGARAALYKVNLERLAVQGFQGQLDQQKTRIDQARRRLHLLELQLRQYEVGRSILLSQLAEARTVEQQYALANQFDPFSAVAAWVRAEGDVRQATSDARAAGQVFDDTADLPLNAQPVVIDPEMLDEQLAELKEQLRRRSGDGHVS
ncbi:MAG TPA: PspA/IM30 family protein [Gemmataceae bacterium]|jgi:phage shock protein A